VILYSIIPPEIVFKDLEEEYYPTPLKVKYKGEIIEVIPIKKGSSDYRVERILGTSPKSFLNPSLQPGMDVSIKAIEFI